MLEQAQWRRALNEALSLHPSAASLEITVPVLPSCARTTCCNRSKFSGSRHSPVPIFTSVPRNPVLSSGSAAVSVCWRWYSNLFLSEGNFTTSIR